MKRFVELFRALDDTTSTLEKVEALAEYFRAAPPRDAVWALLVLLGKPRRAVLPSSVLRAHFMSLGLIPDWLYDESRAHVGDTAETVALLLEAFGYEKDATLELPLHVWLEDQAARVRGLNLEASRGIVLEWWRGVPADEIFVLHKLMSSSFRVGVSSGLVVRGLALALERDVSLLENRLAGEFKPTVMFWESLLNDDAERSASQPYPFMLAHGLEPNFQPSAEWQFEWKWDGIRAQALKRDGAVYLWSRGEGNVTVQFPEITAINESSSNANLSKIAGVARGVATVLVTNNERKERNGSRLMSDSIKSSSRRTLRLSMAVLCSEVGGAAAGTATATAACAAGVCAFAARPLSASNPVVKRRKAVFFMLNLPCLLCNGRSLQ